MPVDRTVPRRRSPAPSAALAVLAALALSAAPAAARGMDSPVPEWREGPARYLLTRHEAKIYKTLKTREERGAFIRQFWARRDPTPETVYNEFRDEFWKRVSQANGLFTFTAKDGWITDRGKLYILLGAPNDIISEEMARSHRGIILWIYRTVWAREIGPNFVVAFARDTSGEFRISTAPSTDADVFRGLAPNTPAHLMGAQGVGQMLGVGIGNADPYLVAQGVPTGATELSLLADLGRLQQTEHLLLNEFVSAQALFGDLPVIASVDYYRADNGTTYTAISVSARSRSLQFRDVAGMQGPDVAVYARLLDPATGEVKHSFEGDHDFVPSPENAKAGVHDYLIFQAGAGIAPGEYKTEITFHDKVAQKIGRYTLDMEVPDFSGPDLMLSSVTLAEVLEPYSGAAPDPTRKKPFVFGNLTVVPKSGNAFAKDQAFAFYYQVYHARTDSETGHPLLDVKYLFEKTDEDRKFRPFGNPLVMPEQHQAANGFSFPLADWPIGHYRLTVQVTDRLDGGTTERSIEFLVR